MCITRVTALYPNWKHLPAGAWQTHFWQIVVQVETDGGVTGLGYGGGGEPGCAVINRHLRELLVGGRDAPRDGALPALRQHHRQTL